MENGFDYGNSCYYGFKNISVSKMYLYSTAEIPFPFIKCWLKIVGAEKNSWKFFFFKCIDYFFRLNKGRPDNLKRLCCSPSLGDVCPFKKNCSRENCSSFNGWHVWRRENPWQVCIIKPHLPFPSIHPDYFQINPNFELFIKKICKLSSSHSVAYRDRVHSDKGRKFFLKNISFN